MFFGRFLLGSHRRPSTATATKFGALRDVGLAFGSPHRTRWWRRRLAAPIFSLVHEVPSELFGYSFVCSQVVAGTILDFCGPFVDLDC